MCLSDIFYKRIRRSGKVVLSVLDVTSATTGVLNVTPFLMNCFNAELDLASIEHCIKVHEVYSASDVLLKSEWQINCERMFPRD